MRGLEGKVAVITGGGNGIGEATARAFAACKAAAVVVDIDELNGRRVTDAIVSHGGRACFVAADVSDNSEIEKMVEVSLVTFGRIDVLVNCAAAFIMRGLEGTPEEWQKMMNVNVIGYALCAKHCVPAIKKVGGGAIVNVCSISGFIAQKGYLTYNTSKGAVANMTRCLALELADNKIRVNSVCPGTVWTQSNERYIGQSMGLDRSGADIHPLIGGAHMLKRCADPSEIADAIVFLASDNASFITAENLMVDGGYTAV